ncbi:hypothetical protein DY000_02031297, partial [Brassica cretica]
MFFQIIEEFQKFYLDHPFGKFFGDCTELKVKLDRCFRRDPLNMSSSGGVGVSDVGISLFCENDIQQWSKEDKIRLCYLAALSGGLQGVNCKSAIPQHLAEMVIDLETFEQHPWGYEAVTDLVFCIKGITPERLSKESYSINGFIQVIVTAMLEPDSGEQSKKKRRSPPTTNTDSDEEFPSYQLKKRKDKNLEETIRNVATQMYHELAKKTIEKVDKFEGQVNCLSHDVEELEHNNSNSMRGDIHLAISGSCVQHSPHIANSKLKFSGKLQRVHGSEIGNDEVLSICENTKSGKDDQTDEPSSATDDLFCCSCNSYVCDMFFQIIEEFQKFYLDHPFGKFFGDCTELKVKLDRCFRRVLVVGGDLHFFFKCSPESGSNMAITITMQKKAKYYCAERSQTSALEKEKNVQEYIPGHPEVEMTYNSGQKKHLAEMVMDLETFEQHPWGYEAVTDLLCQDCEWFLETKIEIFYIRNTTTDAHVIVTAMLEPDSGEHSKKKRRSPPTTNTDSDEEFPSYQLKKRKNKNLEETIRNVATQMYHELAKKTIEKVDKFEGQLQRVHGSEIGNDEVLSICENTKSGKDDQTDEPSSATMIEETVLCCNVFFCQGEDQFAMTSNLSVCEVLNNIDVMSDILLWLPPEMIHKLFLVSKRFLEIISDLFSMIEETVLCCNVFFCQGEDQFAMTSNLSVCEVLNNIDVMSDILLWLPPEMIHKLFLVSKRFLEIISDLFSLQEGLPGVATRPPLPANQKSTLGFTDIAPHRFLF